MSVTLRDVGHAFPASPWLFRGVSLQLVAGRVYALVGPSGAGKSTLLSIIAGLVPPAEGEVLRDDPRVCWVLQNPHGVPRRTALDHVALPLLAAGDDPVRADSVAARLLGKFGLESVARREFRALSGGEAQRLMLARGIAARPGVLLVDEPTAQLDRTTAATVDAAILALAGEGVVVVVATHDQRTREACTDLIDLTEYAGRELAVLASDPEQT